MATSRASRIKLTSPPPRFRRVELFRKQHQCPLDSNKLFLQDECDAIHQLSDSPSADLSDSEYGHDYETEMNTSEAGYDTGAMSAEEDKRADEQSDIVDHGGVDNNQSNSPGISVDDGHNRVSESSQAAISPVQIGQLPLLLLL